VVSNLSQEEFLVNGVEGAGEVQFQEDFVVACAVPSAPLASHLQSNLGAQGLRHAYL